MSYSADQNVTKLDKVVDRVTAIFGGDVISLSDCGRVVLWGSNRNTRNGYTWAYDVSLVAYIYGRADIQMGYSDIATREQADKYMANMLEHLDTA